MSEGTTYKPEAYRVALAARLDNPLTGRGSRTEFDNNARLYRIIVPVNNAEQLQGDIETIQSLGVPVGGDTGTQLYNYGCFTIPKSIVEERFADKSKAISGINEELSKRDGFKQARIMTDNAGGYKIIGSDWNADIEKVFPGKGLGRNPDHPEFLVVDIPEAALVASNIKPPSLGIMSRAKWAAVVEQAKAAEAAAGKGK